MPTQADIEQQCQELINERWPTMPWTWRKLTAQKAARRWAAAQRQKNGARLANLNAYLPKETIMTEAPETKDAKQNPHQPPVTPTADPEPPPPDNQDGDSQGGQTTGPGAPE